MQLTGVIHSGAGKGAYFMQLDWVVRQCEDKLGFTPFPGTLNVHITRRGPANTASAHGNRRRRLRSG